MSDDPRLAGLIAPLERLDSLLLEEHQRMRRFLKESPNDNVMPMLTVILKDAPDSAEERVLYGLAVPFNEHEDKRLVLRTIGQSIREQQKFPVAAWLVSEAWSAPVREPHVQPRFCLDRQEVVVIAAVNLRGECRSLMLPIVRDLGGRITLGDDEPIIAGGGSNLLGQLFAGYFESEIKSAAR